VLRRLFSFTAPSFLSSLAVVLSLLCGALVFFLFRFFIPLEPGEGYALLGTGEFQNDRQIRELLVSAGTGAGKTGDWISESSQMVPVDDFGVFRMVPLDTFHEEIEAFDPRDDGYAARLRAFFVRGGKRYFFLPLKDTSGNVRVKLEKEARRVLGDISFTLAILGTPKSFFWYFSILAAASAGALYFSRSCRLFVFQVPVLLAFGWGGFSSLMLAAVLAGLWELLREPLGELAAARRYERFSFDYAGSGFRGLWERFKPFRINCCLVLLFMAVFAFFCVLGELPLVPAGAGFVCFFLLYFVSFWADLERGRKIRHVPFIPVPLLPVKAETFSLFPLLLPFGAGAVLALVLPLVFPGFAPSREPNPLGDLDQVLSAADYERHIVYERSFSYLSLEGGPDFSGEGPPGGLNQEGYLRYYLGDDGLIAGGASYSSGADHAGGGEGEVPPFPLEKLMEFLVKYSTAPGALSPVDMGGKTQGESGAPLAGFFRLHIKEWISVLVILAACIPKLLRSGIKSKKKKKFPLAGDKRIAA
jgi:hypothetical protein